MSTTTISRQRDHGCVYLVDLHSGSNLKEYVNNVDSTCGQNHSHLVGYITNVISGPVGQLNIKLSFLKGRVFHQQGACENSPLPRREYNFKAKCKIYLNLLQSCPSANCGWNSLAPNFGRFTKSKSIIIISLTSENNRNYRIIAIIPLLLVAILKPNQFGILLKVK